MTRECYPLPAWLTALLCASVVLKLLLLVLVLRANPDAPYFWDSRSYIETSRSLAETGEFALDGVPDTQRTPGYPLFLSACRLLASSRFAWLALTLQVLAGLPLSIAVYKTARAIYQGDDGFVRGAAATAAVLIAFDPGLWVAQYTMLSESVFATLFGIGLCLLVLGTSRRSWGMLLAGSFTLGGAAFIRPIGVAGAYGLVGFALIRFVRSKQWRLGAIAALSLAVQYGGVRWWTSRNERVAHISAFSSNGSLVGYIYFGGAILAAASGEDPAKVRHRLTVLDENVPLEMREHSRALGLVKIMRENPGATLRVVLRTMIVNNVDPYAGVLLQMLKVRSGDSGLVGKALSMSMTGFLKHMIQVEKPLLAVLAGGTCWTLALWLGAVWGLRSGYYRQASELVLLVIAGLALAVPALIAGPGASGRFRVPLIGSLVLVASPGLWRWRRALSAR